MPPKWTQNGAKKRPWTHFGAKVISFRTQCDLEVGSRDLETARCDLTLLPQEPKVGLKHAKEASKRSKRPPNQPFSTKDCQTMIKMLMGIQILKFGLTSIHQTIHKYETVKAFMQISI